MQRIVTITDSHALLEPAAEHLRQAGVEVRQPPPGASADEAVALAAGSPSVIFGVIHLGEQQLETLARNGTELVVRAGIGYDNVDVDLAHRYGIRVANVPDYCVDEVADHALLLLLASLRRLTTLTELAASTWVVADLLPPVHRIRGMRLGIVGFGRIGRQVAARAKPFGFEVVAFDPWADDSAFAEAGVERVPLDVLLATSDAVTLHAPLAAGGAHLIGAAELSAMKPGAVLVNTSRGGLVDLDALDRAIADGTISAAGLDVLDGEPHPPLDHPVLARPETVTTPHTAWYSLEARRALAIKSAEEALRYLDGQPLHNQIPPSAP